MILNDPARGIDVNTKRDLYVHLRNYAEEGNSVVFLSSELEEFIGLCSKVLVFRHGSVFDIFENEKVEPVGLLEGMFGQSKGVDLPSIQKSRNIGDIELKDNTATFKENLNSNSKRIIKIVDFDKEKKLKEENKNNKIKIKSF